MKWAAAVLGCALLLAQSRPLLDEGASLYRQGRDTEAAAVLERAISGPRADRRARLLLALCRQQSGDPEGAQEVRDPGRRLSEPSRGR